MDTLRSLVNPKPRSKQATSTSPQPPATIPPTTPPPQISLPPISLLNISSTSPSQDHAAQLCDLTKRLEVIEEALEYPLHTDASLDARLAKLEEIIGGLKEGVETEEDRNRKLDNALPKIANAIGRISGGADKLKEEVKERKKALRKQGKDDDVKSRDEDGKGGNKENKKSEDSREDEEGDDSFASASEVATDKGIKKDEKLKHMDHGGRTDRIVRTVFEEIDDGDYVEYKKILQELRKDLG